MSSGAQTPTPAWKRSKNTQTPARNSVRPSKRRALIRVGVEPALTTGQACPAARRMPAAPTTASRSPSAAASSAAWPAGGVALAGVGQHAAELGPRRQGGGDGAQGAPASSGFTPERWPSLSISISAASGSSGVDAAATASACADAVEDHREVDARRPERPHPVELVGRDADAVGEVGDAGVGEDLGLLQGRHHRRAMRAGHLPPRHLDRLGGLQVCAVGDAGSGEPAVDAGDVRGHPRLVEQEAGRREGGEVGHGMDATAGRAAAQ